MESKRCISLEPKSATTSTASFDLPSFFANYRQIIPRAKAKKKFTTITDKMTIINDSEQGMSQRQIAKKFFISKTQVGDILQRKHEYLEQYMDNSNPRRMTKLIRRNDNEAVNDMLWRWCRIQADNGKDVSGLKLKTKALQFAEMNGVSGFKASNGWLQCFKQRHNLIKSKRKKILGNEYETRKEPCKSLGTSVDLHSNLSVINFVKRIPPSDAEMIRIKLELDTDNDSPLQNHIVDDDNSHIIVSQNAETTENVSTESSLISHDNLHSFPKAEQFDNCEIELISPEAVSAGSVSVGVNTEENEQSEQDTSSNSLDNVMTCDQETESSTIDDQSQVQIAGTFHVAKHTVNQISKKRVRYLKLYCNNSNQSRCRLYRKTDSELVNKEVWNWYEKITALNTGVHITGTLIKEKALEIAKENNLTNFKASNGWLQSFQQQHNVIRNYPSAHNAGNNVAKSLDEINSLLSYFEAMRDVNTRNDEIARSEVQDEHILTSSIPDCRVLLTNVKMEMDCHSESETTATQPKQELVTSSVQNRHTTHTDALKYASGIRNYALEKNDMDLLRLISLVHRHLEESSSE